MKDYYKILEVEKEATDEEIKKAYHRLAHQYHPDKKGGDEKKFKEINEAYQILGNKEKRAQHDRFGKTFEGGETFSGFNSDFSFDLNDIFEHFFDSSVFARGGPASGWRSWTTTELPINFTQAALGDTIEVATREEKIKIEIPPGIQAGEAIRYRGRNGDYIFVIKIKTPQKISKKAKEFLEELKNEGI